MPHCPAVAVRTGSSSERESYSAVSLSVSSRRASARSGARIGNARVASRCDLRECSRMLVDSLIVPECVYRPGSFTGLMTLYESNYIKLRELTGEFDWSG